MKNTTFLITVFLFLVSCAPTAPINQSLWNLKDTYDGSSAISLTSSSAVGSTGESAKIYFYCKDGSISAALDAKEKIPYNLVTNTVRVKVYYSGKFVDADVATTDGVNLTFGPQASIAMVEDMKNRDKLAIRLDGNSASTITLDFNAPNAQDVFENVEKSCLP